MEISRDGVCGSDVDERYMHSLFRIYPCLCTASDPDDPKEKRRLTCLCFAFLEHTTKTLPFLNESASSIPEMTEEDQH